MNLLKPPGHFPAAFFCAGPVVNIELKTTVSLVTADLKG